VPARPYFIAPKDIENPVVFACTASRAVANRTRGEKPFVFVQCNIAGFYGIYWNGFFSDIFSDRRNRMVTAVSFGAVPWNAAKPDCRGLPNSSSSHEPRRIFKIGNQSVGPAQAIAGCIDFSRRPISADEWIENAKQEV
jgi:hypothetical protein